MQVIVNPTDKFAPCEPNLYKPSPDMPETLPELVFATSNPYNEEAKSVLIHSGSALCLLLLTSTT